MAFISNLFWLLHGLANSFGWGLHNQGSQRCFSVKAFRHRLLNLSAALTSKEVYHNLKSVIKKKYGQDACNVGDEGEPPTCGSPSLITGGFSNAQVVSPNPTVQQPKLSVRNPKWKTWSSAKPLLMSQAALHQTCRTTMRRGFAGAPDVSKHFQLQKTP